MLLLHIHIFFIFLKPPITDFTYFIQLIDKSSSSSSTQLQMASISDI